MNLKLLLTVIKARLLVIILVLAGTVAIATAVTLTATPRYTATTSVVVDFQNRSPLDPATATRQVATGFITGYIATQVDVISSRAVALRVVDSLPQAARNQAIGFFLDPDDAKRGVNVVRPLLASALGDNLTVRPTGDSQVINLDVSTPDAKLSALIADAYAQAYMDVSLDLQIEPAKRNARWFDGQLKDLRARLEDRQRALSAYQREKGIVSIDERLDVENRRFEELSTALVAAQSNTYDVESRQLGQQHPEYVRAVDRERAAQASLARQKARVLEIQQQRDEANLLAREVESSRTMYDQAMQQFYQTSMQSQFTGTNVAVLSKAAIPDQPSSPNLKINLALAVVLGLIFGFAVVFIMEILDRRVRIPEDLSEDLGVPMLASL